MEKKEDLINSENNQNSSPENEILNDDDGQEESPSSLKSQLTEAYSKHESLQSKYLRTVADLDNLKKRSIRDREEAIQRTRLQLMEDLLPTIDAFKIGMHEAEKADPDGPIVNGFKMAINQMQNVLEEYGLVCIEGVGEDFNPKLHEAISYEIGDKEDIVLRVIRTGYRLKDHLIRPASVIVSQKESTNVAS